MSTRTPLYLFAITLAILESPVAGQAAGYEKPPTFEASKLLPAAAVKGPHHAVAPEVTLAGLYRRYQITSDYGPFEALGDDLVMVRLKEVDALTRLSETSEFSVAMKAVGGTMTGAAKGAAHAVTNPGDTVAGVPGGVGRMFGKIGRSAKRTGEKGTEAVSKDPSPAAGASAPPSKSAGAEAADATAGVAKSVTGISAGRRKWAKELGVDPYTDNQVLGAALDKVGQIDAAGRFATKLVPGVAALGMVATVDSIVYSQSPDQLVTLNENRLKAMGVSPELSKALRLNKNVRLSLQTRIVSALDALKGVADREAFLERAAAVDTLPAAYYYADSAEMLERFHRTQGPLARLVAAQGAAVALTKDGRVVHLLPADYIAWTADVAGAVATASERAKTELGGAKPEVWITGEASAQARQGLAAAGWKLHERSLKRPAAPPAGAKAR